MYSWQFEISEYTGSVEVSKFTVEADAENPVIHGLLPIMSPTIARHISGIINVAIWHLHRQATDQSVINILSKDIGSASFNRMTHMIDVVFCSTLFYTNRYIIQIK